MKNVSSGTDAQEMERQKAAVLEEFDAKGAEEIEFLASEYIRSMFRIVDHGLYIEEKTQFWDMFLEWRDRMNDCQRHGLAYEGPWLPDQFTALLKGINEARQRSLPALRH